MEATSTTGESRITIDLTEVAEVEIAANEARKIVSGTLRDLHGTIDGFV